MPSRIAPATPPLPIEIAERLAKVMPPGLPPLTLFTTLARDKRLFERFMGGGLLDPGHLTLRQREIVINRVTALSGSEYEWGVHITFFAKRAGFTDAQIASTAQNGPADPLWTVDERALLVACDQLHNSCTIDDAGWAALRVHFTEESILEILMLAGFYRMVSYVTNTLRLPLESYAARFPVASA